MFNSLGGGGALRCAALPSPKSRFLGFERRNSFSVVNLSFSGRAMCNKMKTKVSIIYYLIEKNALFDVC